MTLAYEQLLPSSVIDFNPITIRVPEIDLLDAIYPVGNLHFVARPIFVFNFIGIQHLYKIRYRRNRKAKVIVLFMCRDIPGALNEVQVAKWPYGKPGMPAVVKGLGDSVELH